MAAPSTCSYDCDDEFRIVAVDDKWSEIAVANGVPELVPPALLGRSLWSYITDRTTAHVFARLFETVIETGRPITVPFRCDSPSLRRYLELTISKRIEGGVHVTSTEVRVEPRVPVALLEADRPRDSEMLKMCGWCKRAELDGRWVEVEELTTALRLFERPMLPQVTHGMCDRCRAEITELIDGLRDSPNREGD